MSTIDNNPLNQGRIGMVIVHTITGWQKKSLISADIRWMRHTYVTSRWVLGTLLFFNLSVNHNYWLDLEKRIVFLLWSDKTFDHQTLATTCPLPLSLSARHVAGQSPHGANDGREVWIRGLLWKHWRVAVGRQRRCVRKRRPLSGGARLWHWWSRWWLEGSSAKIFIGGPAWLDYRRRGH